MFGRYNTDGLNSLNYTVMSKESKPLYTNITVKLVEQDKDKNTETKPNTVKKVNPNLKTTKKVNQNAGTIQEIDLKSKRDNKVNENTDKNKNNDKKPKQEKNEDTKLT